MTVILFWLHHASFSSKWCLIAHYPSVQLFILAYVWCRHWFKLPVNLLEIQWRSDAIRTRFCLWMNTPTRFGNVDRNWEINIFSFFTFGILLSKRFVVFSLFGHEIIRSLFNRRSEWCCVGYFVDARDYTWFYTGTLQPCVSTFLPVNTHITLN